MSEIICKEPNTGADVRIVLEDETLSFIATPDPDFPVDRACWFFVYLSPANRIALARLLHDSAINEIEPAIARLAGRLTARLDAQRESKR